ncbi:MAG TPA: hypothetical protein VIK99_03545 [Thermaerobacter sp.]
MVSKPPFTRDQIVSTTDVMRNWGSKVEEKLRSFPYVLVFSGSRRRTTILPYERFEALWQKAEMAAELELALEVIGRTLRLERSGEKLIPLADVVQKLGLTPDELVGDVELEDE